MTQPIMFGRVHSNKANLCQFVIYSLISLAIALAQVRTEVWVLQAGANLRVRADNVASIILYKPRMLPHPRIDRIGIGAVGVIQDLIQKVFMRCYGHSTSPSRKLELLSHKLTGCRDQGHGYG